eukprot:101491-Prymnesium_polylepis.1
MFGYNPYDCRALAGGRRRGGGCDPTRARAARGHVRSPDGAKRARWYKRRDVQSDSEKEQMVKRTDGVEVRTPGPGTRDADGGVKALPCVGALRAVAPAARTVASL